jgi:hypothetical protein
MLSGGGKFVVDFYAGFAEESKTNASGSRFR